MKFIYTFLFALVLTLCFSCLNGQNYTRDNLIKAKKYRPKKIEQNLLISTGTLGNGMRLLSKNNKIQYVKFMDENRSIDRENYTIDEVKFRKNLIEQFPNRNSTGVCYIDFESPFINDLLFEERGSDKFKRSMAIYVNAYELAKKMRPNVTFGYYGIPFANSHTGDYWDKNEKIPEILSLVDLYFPSVYLEENYSYGTFEKNYEYIAENVKVALRYGALYDKPVYPFIMHRYYSTNKNLLFAKLSSEEWSDYLEIISTTSYGNKYINGVVWWGADDYYFDKSEGKNVRENRQFKSKQDFVDFFDKSMVAYGKEALNILRR